LLFRFLPFYQFFFVFSSLFTNMIFKVETDTCKLRLLFLELSFNVHFCEF